MPTTRRNLIQLAALPLLLPAQQHKHGSSAPPDPQLLRDYQAKFFDSDDFAALQAFSEILIPTDDTPGAREARCAHYIDFVVQSGENPKPWRTAMATLKTLGFHSASPSGREAIVAAISRPDHEHFASFQLIKQQTAFAFYTSREGMIETLDYRGNSFNSSFPPCNHPEHHTV